MPRDYKREYKSNQASPKAKKDRAARNKVRRAKIKELGKTALKGKDIDHIKPLRSGGSKKLSNTRIRASSANKADNGGKGYGRGRPKGSTSRGRR